MPASSRTDLMLLGLLMDQPRHGYEIVETLTAPGLGSWVKLSKTSVYYSLGRLEKDGMVTRHAERHEGKPERSVYSITDAGRERFQRSLEAALANPIERMDEFDIGLYYAGRLDSALVESRMGERLAVLERQADQLKQAVETAELERDDISLVLERRAAILQADIDFIAKLLQLLRDGAVTRGTSLSGDLADVPLHQVLRNLTGLDRTGVLSLKTPRATVSFALECGDLSGVDVPARMSVDDALRAVFGTSRGSFSFEPHAAKAAGSVPVRGSVQVILTGSRGVRDRQLLSRMTPDAGTLLDVRSGYEYETLGVDLTQDECALLEELDGVRTVMEVASKLGWDATRVVASAYPLWAVGWVVRAARDKRELVSAVFAYLRAWAEAVQFFAGDEVVDRVFAETTFAARGAGLPDFWAACREQGSVSFKGDIDSIGQSGRDYVELMERSVATRLSDGFVDEVKAGLSARLPDHDRDLLNRYGLFVNVHKGFGEGSR